MILYETTLTSCMHTFIWCRFLPFSDGVLQLTCAEHKVAEVTMEFQHLGGYFSEYKSRSTEKVTRGRDVVMADVLMAAVLW